MEQSFASCQNSQLRVDLQSLIFIWLNGFNRRTISANLLDVSSWSKAHLAKKEEAVKGHVLQYLQQVGPPREEPHQHPHPLPQEACNNCMLATCQPQQHGWGSGL